MAWTKHEIVKEVEGYTYSQTGQRMVVEGGDGKAPNVVAGGDFWKFSPLLLSLSFEVGLTKEKGCDDGDVKGEL